MKANLSASLKNLQQTIEESPMKSTMIFIATIIASGLLVSSCAVGDDDNREYRPWSSASLDVAPVTSTAYSEECSECHMAYQPGLLPARSWEKLMTNLDSHFEENAELDEEMQLQLTQYLMDNAADKADYKRSRAITRSLSDNETPLRISETRYFLRKHDELPSRMVTGNPKVQSFSRCEVCHTKADTGSYNEHQVQIPGYGQWDD